MLSAARQVLTDWNHQKVPYFSVPPATHPSMVPSMIPGESGTTVVAPGAETVGQAQILTEFSKPFELAGLFGAADAGAFAPQEVMMADDTPEHEAEMVADDTPLHVPLKRSHSPGRGSESELEARLLNGSGSGAGQRPVLDASTGRRPKRLRRARDLSAYEVAAAASHPLRRKALKQDAKKARRAATRMLRRSERDVGMEVEVEELRDTFMTEVES